MSSTTAPASTTPPTAFTYEQALRHHAAGELPQAEVILRRILNNFPNDAHALHLLGIIAHQSDKTELAIDLISKAISNNPGIAKFYANRGEMYRILGKTDYAIEDGLKAVSLDSKDPAAHSNLGIAYYDNKDYENAKKCQKKALKLAPEFAPALNNMGSILRAEKDREGALRYYRKVLSYVPNHLESINNMGALLTELERAEESVEVLLKAVNLKPDYAEAHCNLGCAFLALENLDKAMIGFNQALKFRPDYPQAHEGLAKLYREKEDLDAAEASAKKALESDPDRAESHCLLGNIYSEQGFPELAEESLEKALSLDNSLPGAYLGKGQLLMQQGKLDEAEQYFLKAIELDPDGIAGRLSLAQMKKTEEGDANMAALLAEAKQIDTMPEPKAMSLHFALGKVYEDTKQYDLAFPHFLEGCRLKRKRFNYSTEENDQSTQNIINFYNANYLKSMQGAGDKSDVPIFVLGMPRSGTTLTETIIASHPEVHGAGELPDLLGLANHPFDSSTQRYPASLQGLSKDEITALGTRYVKGLRERNAEAKHITDKMPANFFGVGFIHTILPNAKIIHVNRNPIDTCLSCFARMFNNGQYHTYNLTELGLYYRNYHKLMEHWRKVLPAGSFLDLQYEELVKDKENQTRKLIEFCGLEWDDACLESHKNTRSIRTASVTQVRQPVYTSSIERWRRYETFLEPLIEALGDLTPV